MFSTHTLAFFSAVIYDWSVFPTVESLVITRADFMIHMPFLCHTFCAKLFATALFHFFFNTDEVMLMRHRNVKYRLEIC